MVIKVDNWTNKIKAFLNPWDILKPLLFLVFCDSQKWPAKLTKTVCSLWKVIKLVLQKSRKAFLCSALYKGIFVLQEENFQVCRSPGLLKSRNYSSPLRLTVTRFTWWNDLSPAVYLQHTDSKTAFPMGNRSISFRILFKCTICERICFLFK